MALYHFSIDQVRRSAGQSAIAAAAYRAGERLYSDYYGEISDYTKRAASSVRKFSCRPTRRRNSWTGPPSGTPWSRPKGIPKAQLAYSFDVALQNEFSLEENIALAREFVQRQFVGKGMIADLAVHVPGQGGRHPKSPLPCDDHYASLNADGSFGPKQRREYVLDENGDRIRDENGNYVFNAVHTTDWHEPETLEAWREAWCNLVNGKLEEKGTRLPHRPPLLCAAGPGPDPHRPRGPNVRKMEAKGLATEKGPAEPLDPGH